MQSYMDGESAANWTPVFQTLVAMVKDPPCYRHTEILWVDVTISDKNHFTKKYQKSKWDMALEKKDQLELLKIPSAHGMKARRHQDSKNTLVTVFH